MTAPAPNDTTPAVPPFDRDLFMDAVERYRKAGLFPIPLDYPRKPFLGDKVEGGKRPTEPGWTDPRYSPRWTERFNVGLRMGTKVFALDADGPEGMETVAAWEREHGPLPRTATAETGGGGRHWLFLTEVPVVTRGGVARKVDVRGIGGQIAVEPSVHKNGRQYTWVPGLSPADVPIAPAPAWLLERVVVHRTPGPGAGVERPADLVPDKVAAADYVKRVLPAESGKAGDAMFRIASDLVRGYGLMPEDAADLMHEHWEPRCNRDILREEHGGIDRACERAEEIGEMEWGCHLSKPATPPPVDGSFDVPVDEFLAESIEPPREVVWKLQSAQMAFLYGGANSSKTWMALELSRQAARTGKRVLYVVEEGHPSYLQGRFRLLGLGGPNVRVAVRKGLNLRAPEWLKTLEARVRETRTDLLVIDPLSDCLDGIDESDPREMHAVRDALKRLVGTGACVLVLHHASKLGSRQGGPHDAGMAMENMRGHSILAGAADLMIELRRMKDEEGVSEVEVTKNRNGPLEFGGRLELVKDPLTMRLQRVDFLPGERGQAKTEALREARKAAKAEGKESDREGRILDALRAGLTSRNEIATKAGVGKDTVSGILKIWEGEGRVVQVPGKQGGWKLA